MYQEQAAILTGCLMFFSIVLVIEAEYIFKSILFFGCGKHAHTLQRDILIGFLVMK